MKICHISMYYHPILGGQETYIKSLNDILIENGIEPYIIQPENLDTGKPDNVFFTRYIPYSHYLKKISKHWDWYVFSLSLLFYKKKLSEFDILICHYPFHFPFIKRHKKIIIVSHGVLWSKNSQQRGIFDKLHIYISKKISKSKNTIIVANDTDFLRQIGINAEKAQKYFQPLVKNAWFIPNCVDPNKFRRIQSIEKEKIILVPRNIRPDRGIDLVIRSFSMLPASFNDYVLLIVGSPSDKKYFNQCKSLVNQLSLNERVVFTGTVEWENMVGFYNRAMVTVIPTIEKEGTSLSALESMACMTPVVSTEAGGLADLPTYQCKTTPENLKDGIVEVLQNNTYYAEKQLNEIINFFNKDKWAEAWLKVIKGINSSK